MATSTRYVDDSSVIAGLDNMRERGRQMASVFRMLRRPMREDQQKHAEDEEGPDGAWPPLAASTREARDKRQKVFSVSKKGRRGKVTTTQFKARGVLGVLPELVSVKAVGFSVFARSTVQKIARAQHFGGPVGRGSVLPERPFLFVSESLARLAEQAVLDHVVSGWTGSYRRLRHTTG